MATRKRPTMEDRVAEYVDSPSMRMRVKYKKQISARILGVYGDYRTSVSRTLKNANGTCSCPSEIWPCKHILALRKTWDVNPDSFFDLDKFLKDLGKQPQEWLVEMIGSITSQFPECLSVLGVPGFDAEDENSGLEY